MEKYSMTPERSERVARLFQEAMAHKGFRQKELAEKAGVASSTVSYVTRGLGDNTSFVAVAKLASVLDIDLNKIAAAIDL